jgi:hypothetical protein
MESEGNVRRLISRRITEQEGRKPFLLLLDRTANQKLFNL